jgi:CMP-N-acetylneuraminic acid synthetase
MTGKPRAFVGPHTMALIMPTDRSVDIDTIIDFEVAAAMLAHAGRE